VKELLPQIPNLENTLIIAVADQFILPKGKPPKSES